MIDEKLVNVPFKKALLEVSGWDHRYVYGDERKSGGLIEGTQLKPDLLLTLPAHPLMVVECKLASSQKDPVQDAVNKLGRKGGMMLPGHATKLIRKAVAVRYPPEADGWEPEEIVGRFLGGARVRWKFLDLPADFKYWPQEASDQEAYRQYRQYVANETQKWPQEGYLEGTVSDFVGSVENSSADVEAVSATGRKAADLISASATRTLFALEAHPDEVERISALMGSPGDAEVGMSVAAVVWFDSLLVMNELERAAKNYGDVKSCRTGEEMDVEKLRGVWRRILADNYRSIFKLAEESLPRKLAAADHQDAFGMLAEAVAGVESRLLGRTANIGGEVFAQVMNEDERKRSASFYTKSEYAELLVHAVLTDRRLLGRDWMKWRIGDFACGTGTLLRAGYRRLRMFAAAEPHPPDPGEFHACMMEGALCGLDINPIAVHLTAAGIVGLHPQTAYRDTNIGGMKLGKTTKHAPESIKDVLTGSVELLNRDGSQQQLITSDFSQMRGVQQEGAEENGEINRVRAEDETFDAVLMNPPYSRTRGGQAAYDLPGITDHERKLLQKRDGYLSKGTCGDKKAGMDTAFAAIADRKVKPGGRMGLVLPLTAAAAGSYQKMRIMFEEGYRDVIAVAFGGGVSISADTDIEEMMIFARKGTTGREGVGYVYVDDPLPSANAGAEIARVMVETLDKADPGGNGPLKVGCDQVGSFYAAHPAPKGFPWIGAGMESLMGFYPDAHRLTVGIVEKEGMRTVTFPVTTIEGLFDGVGPTHHNIGHRDGFKAIGAFTMYERTGQKGRETPHLALWVADSERKRTILSEPTHYAVVYRKDKAEKQKTLKSDLFYSRGMSWAAQKILAAVTAEPALGGRSWAALRGGSDITRFAFAVWANSIFGFVNHWAVGQRQQRGRSQTQVNDIRRIPCPDFADPELQARTEQYLGERDELFGLELERAVDADDDTNRRRLDLVAADILGVPECHRNSVADWLARRWAEEPTVSGGK